MLGSLDKGMIRGLSLRFDIPRLPGTTGANPSRADSASNLLMKIKRGPRRSVTCEAPPARTPVELRQRWRSLQRRRGFVLWCSAPNLSPPQLLPVLPLLGPTASDSWILNFSRVLLPRVLVCVSRVSRCCWQNHGPSYLSVAPHIDPFRRALYQYSLWLTHRKALQKHITLLFLQSLLWSNCFYFTK